MGMIVNPFWGVLTETVSEIEFVGSGTTQAAGTRGPFSPSSFDWLLSNLRDEDGNIPSLEEDDLIIVNYCLASQVNRNPETPVGFTQDQQTYINSGSDTNQCIWYKFVDAVPDTQINNIPNKFVSTESASASVMVFRGVDTNTPFDVARVLASGTGDCIANPGAITPSTPGCLVVVCGAGACSSSITDVYSNPGDLEDDTNNFKGRIVVDNQNSIHAIGFQGTLPVGSAFNPLPFLGGAVVAGASWSAVTLALRPA